MFVLNIPPYVSTESLKNAFAEICGPVTSVTFAPRSEQSENGFKTCYVVFEEESALDKALLLRENYVLPVLPAEKFETGLLSELKNFSLLLNTMKVCLPSFLEWCKQYNDSVCDEENTRKEIDEYMQNYDQRVADRLLEESATAENGADEDGWMTVSGKKKRGQRALIRTETAIGKVREKQDKSNKKKELLNFYTFQIRESKKQSKEGLLF